MKAYKELTREERKELARKEILRVAKALGKTPTKADYRNFPNTEITYGQIVYIYKKWNLAIRDAGLKNNKNFISSIESLNKSDLIEPFIDVANREKKMPTYREFSQYYNIPLSLYIKFFGSWNNVKNFIYSKYRDSLLFLPPRLAIKRNRRTKAQIEADRQNENMSMK